MVSSFSTSRTGVASHRGQIVLLAEMRPGGGVSHDIRDVRARACRDVESPACHHCCHCREAPGERGGPYLRGRPVLDLCAAGPLPGRGRGGVRAAVAAAEDLTHGDQRPRGRADLELRKELSGQGLDAGPHTIAWHLEHHHQIRVSAATISRYLTRAGLVTPEPRKRPKSSYIRFAAEQPNERWQSDFIHWYLAGGTEVEIVSWLDDHSRLALSVTAHPVTTGEVTLATFRAAVAAHGAPASTLTDNGTVCTTRFVGGGGGRNGLENELAAWASPRRTAGPATPRPRARSRDSSRPCRNGSAPSPPPPPSPDYRTSSTSSPTSTTPTGRTAPCPTAPPPPPPTQPGPRPPPATGPPTPTTASAPTSSAPPAPSPCARRQAPPHRRRPHPRRNPRPAPGPRPRHPHHQRRHRRTTPRAHPRPARTHARNPGANHKTPHLTQVRGVLDVSRHHTGVSDGIRTHDIQDHNLAL